MGQQLFCGTIENFATLFAALGYLVCQVFKNIDYNDSSHLFSCLFFLADKFKVIVDCVRYLLADFIDNAKLDNRVE